MAITNAILDELIGNAKSEEDLFGANGLLKDLSKQLVERMLETEMSHHLGYEKYSTEGHHTGPSTRKNSVGRTIK